MYLRVVKASKNAFLGYPQTSSKHGKIKAVIGLKGIPQQVSDEIYHLIIVPGLKCLIQGNIILINSMMTL